MIAANKVLEKKMSESEELRTRLEAEFQEKIKTMEKELENAVAKAAGKNCCKTQFSFTPSAVHSTNSLTIYS